MRKPARTWPTSREAIAALELKHGKRSAAYTYHDAAGVEVAVVVRWDRPDGKGGTRKDIRPLHYQGDGWAVGAMPEPRLLYRLHRLQDVSRVYVTEGEKAADAGWTIDLPSTTSSGGSNAARKTDWSPLAGKDVVILTDHDEPGEKYAATVAGILSALAPPATVRIVRLADDWPEMPDTGDLDDWCEHHDAVDPEILRDRIDALVEAAEVWKPVGPVGIREPLNVDAAIVWPEPQPLSDELLPVAKFDAEMLPDVFRPWITDIAERLQCPPDFPAVAAMVVLAGIVGRKIGIRPQQHNSWQPVPNLWGAVIGRPGMMKTPAIQEPLKVLHRLEADAKAEFDCQQRDHEAAVIVAKATRKARESELQKAVRNRGDVETIARELLELEPIVPRRRRYVVNDSSVEKLGELLNENPNGLTVFRDELTGLLRSLDKEGHEGARAFYLEAWNGDGRFVYDRIGRGTVDIPAAILSIMGGIQPGPLRDYVQRLAAGGAGDDGLLQRFQLAVWPDCPKSWRNVDRWPDTTAKLAACGVLQALDQLDAVALGAELDDGEHVPFLRFDDAAQAAFDAWREKLETLIRSGNEHPAVESHLAKYRSLIPSLALLIHLADEPDGGPVSLAALSRAVAWGRYLETHARRIYGAVATPSLSTAHRLAAKILDGSIGDAFALRDVYRKGWSGLTDRKAVASAVDLLVDHDWLQVEQITTDGRTATVHHINPAILARAQGTH